MKTLFLVLLCLTLVYADVSYPFFKVGCQGTALYRGRADPIVEPGVISNHVHRVFGANHFDRSSTSETPLQLYNRMNASDCTTCSITVDKSAYWTPDLYYQYPNGTLELVKDAGPTLYYECRAGTGNQTYPAFKAFPAGFRMTAGNPFKRNYTGTIPEQGINWACISTDQSYPAVPFLPTQYWKCQNGLRAQVSFPQCWDGMNLDSPNHQSHVAYPIDGYDHGNCPSSHPVRLPFLFFEILFSVDPNNFAYGDGSRQPFVLSCGDATGYGLHGDFLNGWDVSILQQALQDVSCFANHTNGDAALCNTLAPYLITQNTDMTCQLAKPIPNYEDIGLNHVVPHLVGCEPITGNNSYAPICNGTWYQNVSAFAPTLRVMLRSKRTGLYVTSLTATVPLTANVAAANLSYTEVFDLAPMPGGGYSMRSEWSFQYVSATQRDSGPLLPARNSPSTWETFGLTFYGGTGPSQAGTEASLLSYSDSKYVTVLSNGQLWPNATSVGTINERFYVVDPNAGVTDTRAIKF